jgi:hypothetical protein
VHRSYCDIENWYGSETADIVYDDQQSKLTSLLIQRGYLDASIWANRRPKYYIEVKATTGTLDVPFFVSPNQYHRIEYMMLPIGVAADKVYLFARVYNLGHSEMGLKLYLDPARLRLDGVLQFRAEKYMVTPTARG